MLALKKNVHSYIKTKQSPRRYESLVFLNCADDLKLQQHNFTYVITFSKCVSLFDQRNIFGNDFFVCDKSFPVMKISLTIVLQKCTHQNKKRLPPQ